MTGKATLDSSEPESTSIVVAGEPIFVERGMERKWQCFVLVLESGLQQAGSRKIWGLDVHLDTRQPPPALYVAKC